MLFLFYTYDSYLCNKMHAVHLIYPVPWGARKHFIPCSDNEGKKGYKTL